MVKRALVVKCTTLDPEPCSQAFTVASMALASGATVSMWLTGDATYLAIPGRAEQSELAHAAPLSELLATLIDDGQVTVCTQCAARRNLTQSDLLADVRIAGAASFVSEILAEGVQALVYGAGS